MGKETIRVSFPIPQSGVQASPLLQRLRGLLAKHGRMFYTGYHPAIRAANPFLPAPFGSHADGFCIVPSPLFSGLIRD